MKFMYRCGQQPLPGYTMKRGIGFGGFGEVYFAVSDGGKEVALKWIRNNFDVELRGVQQCLNLKHPNLVHLYDVRKDADGNHWLVMEYVSGEPLSTILARHPNGLAPELAAEWFQGLAGAIHYLHEHGIVHRDLKPGNIFLENGLIKVGDYGLCKFIGGSQRAGMTKEVGTVHYMAPEISTGNYNRHIDVYAAGVILYEMLTGHVPFDGESAGEILMKHMTSPPNLAKVPREFVPVVEQALEKNPARRYGSISEMSKKVAAVVRTKTEPVRNVPPPLPAPPAERLPVARPAEVIPTAILAPSTMRQRWSELSGSLVWAVVFSGLFSIAWALFFGHGDYSRLLTLFYLTLAGSWAVLIPSKLWPVNSVEDSWSRRLLLMTLGFCIGLFALWLEGYELPLPWLGHQADSLLPWARPQEGGIQVRMRHGHAEFVHPRSFFTSLYAENGSMPVLACFVSYFGLMFMVLRWWKTAEPGRKKRFSFKPVLAVAFWAYLLLFLLPALPHRQIGFISMVLVPVVCQLVSPWKEPTPARAKRLRLACA